MSFIIIVITARFSPVYSLNDRLIALSIGIEENEQGFGVIIEANPNKSNGENVVVKGSGNSVSSAILDIENNSNKKVSLAQIEILYLSSNLIKQNSIKYLDSDELKDIPEVAVVVVTDKPSEVIGSKISDNKLKSYEIGSAIRENKEKVSVLEVNIKDLGRDSLSFMGVVTLPYLEIKEKKDEEESEGTTDNQQLFANKSSDNSKKSLSIKIEKGYAFNDRASILLDNEQYLIYQLINEKNKGQSGSISFVLDDNNNVDLWINKVSINKNFYIENNNYIAKYDVNLTIYDNESCIVSKYDKLNKIKITDVEKNIVEKTLNKMGSDFINVIKTNELDILHLMEKFNIINEVKIHNEEDFISELKLDINFTLDTSTMKK